MFHTDAVQAVGKIPINLKNSKIDMLSLSGHKLHAPKGIGVLYLRRGCRFRPPPAQHQQHRLRIHRGRGHTLVDEQAGDCRQFGLRLYLRLTRTLACDAGHGDTLHGCSRHDPLLAVAFQHGSRN
ncbi:hypothetical protein PROAA_3140001 [Candidatus Propionivibrio aalborgensis]|uniref:Aminotransferase class V domain-containing protein n=1 Tax=Candidatus Propionivibrio aalborgensis TaxID=1860101 RepID=A0A1A8XYU4_9RHOO|nr:hypothetical protein PROAA_3140001 [Candidatus Propionivibrio aalborgensis]